ncbi:hypothetical protein [Tautonia plasticadhaerens]|uniref:Uncharacterized protein n=1 Tax=Tautonia plasticadhaerens TaxID=2527974 RepID=A0A518H9K7_9BACT|nr:hypothetical protein [Tautonia plasticadhaerens]QDV37529.1 hypothetical protein ElP_54690 [Tautonia plasticadhaerens]
MFHRPVQAPDRHFSRSTLYVKIDWSKLSSVVYAFMDRITDWYIGPGSNLASDWHNAFSVMAIDCLLIDMLAQFEKGAAESSASMYVDFVKRKLPEFAPNLPAPIRRPTRPDLVTGADVLYSGFRCGIVHEAHIPPYAAINPEPGIVRYVAAGHAVYADGTDCSSVFVDPIRLFRKLEGVYESYIAQLLDPDPSNENLRLMFKRKFTSNYGIDVSGAV